MKSILATAIIVASGITGIYLWDAAHTQRSGLSSSQIYIHGTPVCVIAHDRGIIASVGMCDPYGKPSWGRGFGTERGFRGESPYDGEAPSGLPPGHPPVDSIPTFGEGRRILI